MNGGGLVVGLTGGTGHIGGLLLERLAGDPSVAEVRSVARRPLPLGRQTGERPSAGAARVTHVTADLTDGAARQALQGCDVLYHLAAQVWQGRGAQGRQRMYAANVEGTRNVLAARPGAVVLASSVAVYGAWPDNPLPLEETHLARPNRECAYALDKLLAEGLCADHAGAWTVVRLAAVAGPHADARVARALRGYRLAVPAVRGVPQAVQWLDEADAADGLVAAGRDLAGARRAAGQVVNLATTDWLDAAGTARLAGSRVLAVPRPALLAASELGRRLGLAPFGADRAVLVSGPLAVSAAKAADLLGWRPAKTSAEVLAEALSRDWRGSPRNRVP